MAKRRNKHVISWGFFCWILAFYTLGLAALVTRYSWDANHTASRMAVRTGAKTANLLPDSWRSEVLHASFIASDTIKDWRAR